MLLMLPTPGIPLSVEQEEEYKRGRGDGTFSVEYTVTARQYRDSAGRVRIESETKDQAGNRSGPVGSITDPVAGLQTSLSAKKIAYRRRRQEEPSGDVQFVITDAADGQDSPHEWTTTHTETEHRIIEGYEFKGSQITISAQDVPGLTTTIGQWYSDELKLIGAVDRKGPNKAYTIRIEHLRLAEPDPLLFKIPSEYKIVDLPI